MAVKIDRQKCCYCSGCVAVCPVDALTLRETIIEVNENCIECFKCVNLCPVGAIYESNDQSKSTGAKNA